MLIRLMEEADIAEVADIEFACFGKRDPEAIEKCFKNPIYTYLVADNSGVVVGYSVYMDSGDDAELIQLAVDSMYRHRGVGYSLSREMVKRIKRSGKKNAFLEVRKSNMIAIALYNKLGFIPISVRKKYYDGVEDAVVMKYSIS